MDGIVVLSVGGDALAEPESVRAVARHLALAQDAGRQVVSVLHASRNTRDELLDLAHAVSPVPDPRELDMLVTTGARISCALCAIALIDQGRRAVSLTGSQAGIITDTRHGGATVVDVRSARVRSALDAGAIVLVAGSQGVSTELEVTALPESAADTTAEALAVALGGTHVVYVDPRSIAVR
jgi:aspartate kinase